MFYVANVSFNTIRENKILAKISEFTVHVFLSKVPLKWLLHLDVTLELWDIEIHLDML